MATTRQPKQRTETSRRMLRGRLTPNPRRSPVSGLYRQNPNIDHSWKEEALDLFEQGK